MGSTISAADLTITITETITLNGRNQGASNSCTIEDINEVFKRIVTCPASNTTTIATFNSNVHGAAGAIDVEDARWIRVTNKDDTAPITLAVVGAATLYQISIEAGRSHVLCTPDGLMLSEADTSPSFGTKADISSLQINPGAATVDVELFIASI
jgi:hypothetical protein